VPWSQSRKFFATRLRERLVQEDFKRMARKVWPGITQDQLSQIIISNKDALAQLCEKAQWVKDSPQLQNVLTRLRRAYISRQVASFALEDPEAVALGCAQR